MQKLHQNDTEKCNSNPIPIRFRSDGGCPMQPPEMTRFVSIMIQTNVSFSCFGVFLSSNIFSVIRQMRCVRSVEVKLSKTLRWECWQKHAKDEENSSDEEMTHTKKRKLCFSYSAVPCVLQGKKAQNPTSLVYYGVCLLPEVTFTHLPRSWWALFHTLLLLCAQESVGTKRALMGDWMCVLEHGREQK